MQEGQEVGGDVLKGKTQGPNPNPIQKDWKMTWNPMALGTEESHLTSHHPVDVLILVGTQGYLENLETGMESKCSKEKSLEEIQILKVASMKSRQDPTIWIIRTIGIIGIETVTEKEKVTVPVLMIMEWNQVRILYLK